MIKGFKEFIAQGNALDLAVAVIIGAAFSPIVTAITDVIMAVIAGVVGQPNFDDVLAFTINGSVVQPGTIITAVINFLLVAFAVYFCIVAPLNKLKESRKAEEEPAAAEPTEAELLVQIRDLLASK
ncbi:MULTISPECIES: large conductance mechanosensitive channel protein MscL [unclassified Actinomyces]|uniref:large conductance mechanosensitive channel protein MscL n=1 Tax=unclassified Actinomyces TaxID=2609248 RepID=UPI0020180CA0|nr:MULTISPECIES: large conductance mechanosensitive channel protein MscL [unclassified Actinomyces]MCL3778735.1 large conductance mechanosensitive channel protein MscL [Actinomyces sp. AC-20-1]MCL3789819.1 large conductance mechanosensitive channel protein MscL [Actinomyces sp. 187325]MCL3792437.1 large conductance mechanosensitive channel protein MscL [Actinomyces sp. 186855]MCL3794697.1 large conductance mechanosensitive channel protein MscL [Actinomyces sp. 217892]